MIGRAKRAQHITYVSHRDFSIIAIYKYMSRKNAWSRSYVCEGGGGGIMCRQILVRINMAEKQFQPY